ncbi:MULTISPECIES: ABC transporter permease [Pseudobutyrivibrio]|uniref:Transport permease protein n=1 Tax=Pseudobutyrivibrio xylanivorans TaxID=185007 RepID=A0A1G5S4N3_PSEXY|nr:MULTISPECIES: ABC transporter permease [Pseudobutyrivibrio]MDC7280670.1 ABC transporter permease [Butyrivibrio fibrisolvens]SCZ80790.1 ABC-2 type transport system permease protein [Pseudobutyrivibrio xylanivorans]
MREYLNALWELTKRELRRKYARSYLGILWSSLYPFLRMLLVVFLFSTIFDKGIDRYPAYYFTGYLMFEFFNVGSVTSVTTLRDNKDLLIKSKLSKKTFVMSRVNTAFINLLLGSIPYIGVLIYYKAILTPACLLIIPDLFFLYLFVTGMSYILSILYVYFKDIRNIHVQLLNLWRFFIALFYHVDWVSPGVRKFIELNPIYSFIKISRDCLIYGRVSEGRFFVQAILYSVGVYLLGSIIFEAKKNSVLLRL